MPFVFCPSHFPLCNECLQGVVPTSQLGITTQAKHAEFNLPCQHLPEKTHPACGMYPSFANSLQLISGCWAASGHRASQTAQQHKLSFFKFLRGSIIGVHCRQCGHVMCSCQNGKPLCASGCLPGTQSGRSSAGRHLTATGLCVLEAIV